ncbi:MAG TPA: hypothetical protein VL202_16795 [Pararhizobium sp.]|uniref:hypothetical protein n=1 Tax=Pararhizobium sp. TaxID=1977563 RepID=UPI002BB0DE1A|nr:hypothetical protein [Pararhizobium sp.]HTO32818.1 hypothetical protein [Pararhizobium sp.]
MTMMHGGSKTIGGRNATRFENELEDYFAELQEQQPELRASASVSHGIDHSEELRRLAAYVAYLKQKISELPQSLDQARYTTWPSASRRSPGIGFAGCLIAGLAVGLTAHLVAARR